MKNKNDFADWLFKRLLALASGRTTIGIKLVFEKIERTKPKKRRKIYIGTIGEVEPLGWRSHMIRIDPRISERSKIRVFCHELLHILFDVVESEPAIEKMEYILWKCLSEKQKQLLGKYMYQRAKIKFKNPA